MPPFRSSKRGVSRTSRPTIWTPNKPSTMAWPTTAAAPALQGGQDARDFLRLSQAVEDRRGVADGDHVVLVEAVLDVVRRHMLVDPVVAVVSVVQPQRRVGEGAQVTCLGFPARAFLVE